MALWLLRCIQGPVNVHNATEGHETLGHRGPDGGSSLLQKLLPPLAANLHQPGYIAHTLLCVGAPMSTLVSSEEHDEGDDDDDAAAAGSVQW